MRTYRIETNDLLRKAVVDIAPGRSATTIPMPVSINGTLKSIAWLRSVVIFNEVNVKSARFSRSSAIRPFHLFYFKKIKNCHSNKTSIYSCRIPCSPCSIGNLIEFKIKFQSFFKNIKYINIKSWTTLIMLRVTIISTSKLSK